MNANLVCKVCDQAERDAANSFTKCMKCRATFYCSRLCKKSDRISHRKYCPEQQQRKHGNDVAPSRRKTVLNGPTVTKPFTRLEDGTWLHDRPSRDVYTLLIDAYRLRMNEECRLEKLRGFRRFLDLLEKKPGGLLPPGWGRAKRDKCCRFGSDDEQWSGLGRTIEEEDVIWHYGNVSFPDQLRMFACEVYGGSMSIEDWAGVRARLAQQEKPGGILDGYHEDEALVASEVREYQSYNYFTGTNYLWKKKTK